MTVKTDWSAMVAAEQSDRLKQEGPRVSTRASDPIAAGRPRYYGLMTTFTQPSDFSWNIL